MRDARRIRSRCATLVVVSMLCAACDRTPPGPPPIVQSEANSLRTGDAAGSTKNAGRTTARDRDAIGASARGTRKPDEGPAWFADMTSRSGVRFKHVSGNTVEKPFPAANGSGLGAIDYDLDGLYDLYFVTGCKFPLDPQRREPANAFYRNLGEWKFVDVSEQSGTRLISYSAGVTVADFDSDGFPDLFVSCFGPDVLYHNQGDGTFTRIEQSAGVDDPLWGASAAAADFNEDGLLDLYLCNYAKWTWETHPFCGDQVRKIRMHCGPRTVEPEPHRMYLNNGDGTFRDGLADSGVGARRGRGQGVLAADLNGDGHVDLYVGNDLHPNFTFFGKGDGTFTDATELSGAAYDGSGNEQASMGVDAADVNQDGRLDLIVTNFQHEYNTLYENVGDGFFLDVTGRYGLVADSMPNVGWGVKFIDFNLDGRLDLIVTNGHVDDNRTAIAENTSYTEPPLLYRGENGRFRRLYESAGDYFQKDRVGRGLVTVDLDNDGDVDLSILHQDELPALIRNERIATETGASKTADAAPPVAQPVVQLRLIGRESNRDAVGATIVFRTSLGVITHPIQGGASYLSACDLRASFAVPATAEDGDIECEIRWPRGRIEKLEHLRPGDRLIVLEGGPQFPLP